MTKIKTESLKKRRLSSFLPWGKGELHILFGEKGTKLPQGTNSFDKQVPKCLIIKFKGQKLSKSSDFLHH
jgi:hypothetical protein